MVTIGKVGTGQGAYYTAQVAEGAEEYYAGEGEAPGRWEGALAKDLGLAGTVEADQLTAMLSGNHPATGDPLGLRAVGGRGPVPGFDVTFSSPKSVSLVWALGDDQVAAEVNAAHRSAVEAGMGYLQREACLTRRGAEAEMVPGKGFLAAAFRHRTSRAGDPQLHTHVLIANATQGADGKWTRLHHPSIYDHAKTASYIYEAHLRHELTERLGVSWQEVRKGIAEIEGFEDGHLREFSTRRKQILEAAGPEASARSRQIANLTTRTAKEEGATLPELRERWGARAEEVGLTPKVIESVTSLDRVRAERTQARQDEYAREAGAVPIGRRDQAEPGRPEPPTTAELAQEVTAHASHFDRREAIQAVGQLSPQGAPAQEIESRADAFLASPEVIRIAETAKGARFTTKRIWELERKALRTAGEMQNATDRAVVGDRVIANVIALRPGLKGDQREMVSRLLGSGKGIEIVIGEAGTGKTYATVAAAEGWAAGFFELRVAAPTWRAANVLRSEGLEATSVARLLLQLDRAERRGDSGLSPHSVLLVDEAGMVDSATLARLIAHADAADAKLVLIGDPEQLPAIEAGGLFSALAERSEVIHLDEVIRHRHQLDRDATKMIREGEGGAALRLYRSGERVVIAPDTDSRRKAIVADWHESFSAGEDAVMVAKRNAEVAALNEQAREVMKQAGRLSGPEIKVGESHFAAGDQVITRVNDHAAHIYNRERWEVEAVDPQRGSVVLRGIDQARKVEVDADYLAQTNREAAALQHAYAVTTYSAQGTTVDRAFVAVDPSMDKQEIYVATSRAREETQIYATPEIQEQREEFAPRSVYLREGIPHIAEAAERDGSQVAAHDLAELRALPDEELSRMRAELAAQAQAEQDVQRQRELLEERVEQQRGSLTRLENARDRGAEQPGHPKEGEIDAEQREQRGRIAETEAELNELPTTSPARDQIRAIEAIQGERVQMAVTAARLRPPNYIKAELGERPAGGREAKTWDRAVSGVERYRRDNRVTDPNRALGPKPERENVAAEASRRKAEQGLREARRKLGRETAQDRSLGAGRGMGR